MKTSREIYKTGYKFDKTDSGIVFLKSFPKNSEIGARVNFRAEETKRGSVTIPNTRILSLTLAAIAWLRCPKMITCRGWPTIGWALPRHAHGFH